MKLRKNVDERQELEFLRVERIGFWVMYWGLFIALIVQLLLNNFHAELIWGELAVLFLGSIVVVVGCARRGLWSRCIKLSVKSNAVLSLIGALAVSLLTVLLRVGKLQGNELLNSLPSILYLNFLPAGIACFAVLSAFGAITKRRKEKLESEFDSDEEPKE